MNKLFPARIRQFEELISSYRYPQPFSIHLISFFKNHKEMGSKDRKQLRHLAYSWMRIGRLFNSLSVEEQLLAGDSIVQATAEGRIEDVEKTLQEESINANAIFPFQEGLNAEFQNPEFQNSHLLQPYVWLRIKDGHELEVLEELREQNLPFLVKDKDTVALAPESKLDTLKSWKEGNIRIQDYSSQQTGNFFKANSGELWWDACAGGGGKSLLLQEKDPSIKLWVSDIRKSVLENLKSRMKHEGYPDPETRILDLEKPFELKLPDFDGIIIDAPCSGSGTWARNPENLKYYNSEETAQYAQRQFEIVKNALTFLKEGRPLIYITCSVFSAENENLTERLSKELPLKIEEQQYLKGYAKHAENMFISRLIKTGG